MIDHISLHVKNYKKSKAFYLEALKPLGYELVMEFPNIGGFGAKGKPDFWIEEHASVAKTHIAFGVKRHKEVDEFYKAALKAGGRDNGKPGLRPHYHKDYYAAFVFDLDGNNIEAVSHKKG